jgi:hypothetical protein
MTLAVLGLACVLWHRAPVSAADAARARPVLEPYAGARFRFGGPMGERIEANVRHRL